MNDKQKIKQLKRQLAGLKKQNRKLKKQNNQLKRTTTDKNIQRKVVKKYIKQQPPKHTGIYRASLHYLNKTSVYESEFYAEVHTMGKLADQYIKRQLLMAIQRKLTNRGIQTMFNGSTLIGFENEEIGVNDLGGVELNRVRVTVEVR